MVGVEVVMAGWAAGRKSGSSATVQAGRAMWNFWNLAVGNPTALQVRGRFLGMLSDFGNFSDSLSGHCIENQPILPVGSLVGPSLFGR
jgi:hypothetical protein